MSDEERADASSDWQCAVCMSAYTRPKLLPCSHTFCQGCLEDLVNSGSYKGQDRFPCPICRENIQVPYGGVASFKNNIYISENTSGILCGNHPKAERRPIELNCLQCNVYLCLKCKINHHMNHRTEEVAETADRGKKELTGINNLLKVDIDNLLKIENWYKKELKDIHDKKKEVEMSIKKKCSLMKKMVDRLQEEALFSLDTATASIESQLQKDNLKRTIADLERLHKSMDKCISCKDAATLLMTAPKIVSEIEAQGTFVRRVQADSSAASQIALRQTLNFSGSVDLIVEHCRNFVGNVVCNDMPAAPSVLGIREQFHSDKGADRDIFALMALNNDVYLSYEKGLTDTDEQEAEVCTADGEEIEWPGQRPSRGKVSFTVLDSGKCGTLAHEQGSNCQSFAKSCRGLMLQSASNGTSVLVYKLLTEMDLVQDKIANLSTEPGNPSKGLCILQCGRHRSFDFLHSQQLTAVVEEAVLPFNRSVIVFSNGQRVPYGSPVLPYQPSDVCFHQLGGRDVLLVADELNDAIHVVDVRTGKFLRYLAPGHPLVIQPTALNVDTRGRLWIACRGGAVLLCEPV